VDKRVLSRKGAESQRICGCKVYLELVIQINPPNPLVKGESPKLNINHPLWISDSIYNKNLPSDLILNGSKDVNPPFQRGQGGFFQMRERERKSDQ
jgi:hypothetical protein